MNDALNDNDLDAYVVRLGLCRNISASISELTDMYTDALDKETRGW